MPAYADISIFNDLGDRTPVWVDWRKQCSDGNDTGGDEALERRQSHRFPFRCNLRPGKIRFVIWIGESFEPLVDNLCHEPSALLKEVVIRTVGPIVGESVPL